MLQSVSKSINSELPEFSTMDEYLDVIIPELNDWGEDLGETEFYMNKRWLEIRDTESFHESVLHIFQDGNEYLHSVDGNISKGAWKILPASNTLILERMVGGNVGTSELFDLAFMNDDFFILRKHGDQQSKGRKKYFVMANEGTVRDLDWREIMDLLYDRYRNSKQYMWLVIAFLVVLAAAILFSLRY